MSTLKKYLLNWQKLQAFTSIQSNRLRPGKSRANPVSGAYQSSWWPEFNERNFASVVYLFIERINQAGGVAFVARDLRDVVRELGPL